MIVAHQRQHAAVFGGAGEIGVAEYVAGPVDARALAVPHRKHAVVFAFAAQLRLLRAPDRRGGEVFIDPGRKADVVFVRNGAGALELAVEPPQRQAPIPAHVARGIEPVPAIKLLLHQAEPHQRLIPGNEHPALTEIVFVVELDVANARADVLRPVCLPGHDPGHPGNIKDI